MHHEVSVTSSVVLTETDGSIGVTIEEDGTLHRVPSVVPVRTDRVFAFPILAGILHLADLKGWGSSKNRKWDAPTPRTTRGGSPGSDDGAPVNLDMREWEEEQIRLDRDWYNGAEEGGIAGDEDFNPLSQYEDLGAARQAELATRQVVRVGLICKLMI